MKIITHPGRAHRDDFLSVCFLLHRYGMTTEVERREPTPEELADPEIVCVDVGREHDPVKNNFDHHQFSASHDPQCALSLVLRSLELYEQANEFEDWLYMTEVFDSKGPKAAAELMKCPMENLPVMMSPIEMAWLEQFGCFQNIPETIKLVMYKIAAHYVSKWRDSAERLYKVRDHLSFFTLKGLLIAAVDLPWEVNPTLALENYFRRENRDPAVVISRGERGPEGSWKLYRRNEHPWIDFRSVTDCHFIHSNGFLAVTNGNTSMAEALKIVSQAIRTVEA